MKLDKEQKKELRNLIVAYAKKLGYKARQNTIFRVKDAAMVYCDFLVVDSKKLVYSCLSAEMQLIFYKYTK